jgi:hypothetical protein
MPFGFADTHFVNFPEGQTENRLKSLTNRLNINYLEFVRRTDAAITALNAADPVINLFTYDTTKDTVTAKGGSDKVWQRAAEYGPGRPQRGKPGRGHLLPFYHYEIDLGFTDRALKTMEVEQFTDELRDTVQAIARGRRADVLERLFNADEIPLDMDGNGASPGFAGSGTGTNAFVGILPNGQETDGAYTHYFQMADTEAGTHAGILAMVAALENWYAGPFDLYGSATAIEKIMSYVGDDKFVSNGSSLIRPGEAQSQALVDASTYLGVYAGKIRIRYPDLSLEGDNFVIFKPFPVQSQLQPLAWRWDTIFGREAYVEDRNMTPLTEAMVMQSYGVGVSNRVSVTVALIGGTPTEYEPPTVLR